MGRFNTGIEALKPLRYQHRRFDNETRHQARILASKMKNFPFLYPLNNIVSKMHINIKTGIGAALIAIKNIREYITNYRSDNSRQKLLEEAN